MSYIVVDVESDGPYPGEVDGYSMVCFGAVIVEPSLSKTFYGKVKPISREWKPDALAISGFTRKEHEKFDDPIEVMENFINWINTNTKGRPVFISDNNGYDWQFINFYLWRYGGKNPFGFSSRRIGDMWCGYKNDMHIAWKWMRETTHTHNPVDDAKGNAEALLQMQAKGLNIKLI